MKLNKNSDEFWITNYSRYNADRSSLTILNDIYQNFQQQVNILN